MSDRSLTDIFTDRPDRGSPELGLPNGSRVAVIGGGPAGSFFSYFLLDMASRIDLDISLDMYEPRDFTTPGPPGCNMCAGIVSESLVQLLATEGIDLPTSVVQRGIDSYVLHMDVGSVRLETPLLEKRIGAVYRGAGPRELVDGVSVRGLDGYLQSLAVQKGARLVPERVTRVSFQDGRPVLERRKREPETYDLLAVGTGVNSPLLRAFEEMDIGYEAPKTTKAFVREYFMGADSVDRVLGNAIHVFLLDIPKLEFGMLIPKGGYVTVSLLGETINNTVVQSFLDAPEVRKLFGDELKFDDFACQCAPSINIAAPRRAYADRVVFIGDSGATRLYKDGVGSAYRTAKAAAMTAIFHGTSAEHFRNHYWPTCRSIERDNRIGRWIFAAVKVIQRIRLIRRATLRMILREQRAQGKARRMSIVQWDMYTGSSSYREILKRMLHPGFGFRFAWDMLASLLPGKSTKTQGMKSV